MSIPFPGVKGGKELTLASRLWKIFLEEMPQHSKSIKKKKKSGGRGRKAGGSRPQKQKRGVQGGLPYFPCSREHALKSG